MRRKGAPKQMTEKLKFQSQAGMLDLKGIKRYARIIYEKSSHTHSQVRLDGQVSLFKLTHYVTM